MICRSVISRVILELVEFIIHKFPQTELSIFHHNFTAHVMKLHYSGLLLLKLDNGKQGESQLGKSLCTMEFAVFVSLSTNHSAVFPPVDQSEIRTVTRECVSVLLYS